MDVGESRGNVKFKGGEVALDPYSEAVEVLLPKLQPANLILQEQIPKIPQSES